MFSSIKEIENYLYDFIPAGKVTRFPGEEGIIRTKEFLKLLGSPQNKLKVIHVAGTSGKGSTSLMISTFLHSQGFKTGLHLSPHLLDIRERVEINNMLLSEEKYYSYFNEIASCIEKMRNSIHGKITYFEILVGFAYFVFVREKVDYAVMEVGLGGKYDGTNVVERTDKLAVISKIGFDHMKVLGNTLTKIAYQKAMICMEKGTLISIYQKPHVEQTIAKIVKQKKAHILLIKKSFIKNISVNNETTEFSFRWNNCKFENFRIGLLGFHQAENAALALRVVFFLSERDNFNVNIEKIINSASALQFKGRMEIVKKDTHNIILDGAHNVQKMKAFLKTVVSLDPQKKYTFIVAFKNDKEHAKILKYIVPLANRIILTTIFSDNQDLHHFSADPIIIRDKLLQLGFKNIEIMKKGSEIKAFIDASETDIIITGSLYLLGDIYKLL